MFKRSARGLFDLAVASMAVATLLTTTPAGELLLRGGRWALGMKQRRADLISFFGDPDRPIPPALTAPEPSGLLATVARAYGTAPAILKGFAVASTSDAGAAELAMDNLTPAGWEALRAHGANDGDLATPAGRLRAASRAIVELTRELGTADAALCALVVGKEPTRYAVERVKAERGSLTLEALTPHLAPTVRSRAEQTVGLALALATAYDLSWPVKRETRISSRFGTRTDPISGARSHHNGIDLALPTGTPVWSSGDGVVKRAGEDGVSGRFVVIDHGRGITSVYCHNSEILVARGAPATRGATIVRSGNTGRSTGPHLHYMVTVGGVPVDPLAFLASSDRAVIAESR